MGALFLFFLALFVPLAIPGHASAVEPFGYISHSTINVGDDIQSIAVKRFLPENAIAVDREFISAFSYPASVNTVISGWFMHQKDHYWDLKVAPPDSSWPPAGCINPFFISIHLTGTFLPTVFSEKHIHYLKEHAPIGARDFYTLNELQKRGIPSYFSGCLTLTLENDFAGERNDTVYLVDLDQETIDYIKSKTTNPIVVVSHGKPLLQLLSVEHRLRYAEHILDLYKRCKCVVTTRLHASMPCLAFDTPILMISSLKAGSMDARFEGLVEHTWHCSKEELLKGQFVYDFNNPPNNPQTHLAIRDNLINIMTNWVSSQR